MSMNNILPAWVYILGAKQDNLSKSLYLKWLKSDESKCVPDHVRKKLLNDRK